MHMMKVDQDVVTSDKQAGGMQTQQPANQSVRRFTWWQLQGLGNTEHDPIQRE